jgi:hypothetical protein
VRKRGRAAAVPPPDEPEPTAPPPPANDDSPPPPAPAAKSAIATSISRKRTKFLRTEQAAEPEPDGPEADAAMRAWLERAKWGRGPAGWPPPDPEAGQRWGDLAASGTGQHKAKLSSSRCSLRASERPGRETRCHNRDARSTTSLRRRTRRGRRPRRLRRLRHPVLNRYRRSAGPALGASASASGWVWGQAGDQMSRAPPRRHWRSYGNDPLPTGAESVDGGLNPCKSGDQPN